MKMYSLALTVCTAASRFLWYSTAPKLGAPEDGLRDHRRVGPDPVAPLSVRQHWLSQIWFQFGEAKKLQVAAADPAMSRYFELSSRRRAADGVQLGAPPQRSSFWRRWTQAHGTLLIGRGLPSTPLSLQPPPPPYGHTHPNGVWGGGGGGERGCGREWLVRVCFQTIKCVFLGHPIHFRKI